MKPRITLLQPRREEGSVLIIIAGVLAALSLMAITFSTLARIEMRCAQNAHDQQMAIAAARAGVGIALEMLAQDETLCDDWRDPWYTPQYAPGDPISRPRPTQFGSHRCVTIAEGKLRGVSEIGAGINEDGSDDMNGDGAPGIRGVDDDGDGLVDEDAQGRERDHPQYNPDPTDDDEDGRSNEDPQGDLRGDWDGAPGLKNTDDDNDGLIDECGYLNHDNDGDGLLEEDIPGDHINISNTSGLWSEDRFDEGTNSSIYSEDYPSTSLQRNESHQARLDSFVNGMKNWQPDRDFDDLVNECMWYVGFTYNNWWWDGSRQQYPFMDGDDAEGQRRVDENGDGCADGFSWGWPTPNNPGVYNSTGGRFSYADEDRRTLTSWDVNVSGGEPEGVSGSPGYNRFRSLAGGIYGHNAEDDDEDSDLLTPDENLERDGIYWWKVGRPGGFIRDEAGKINLNVHGSLYDPALFFDPQTLECLGRRGASGDPVRYTGYAQTGRGLPFHDIVNPQSGGNISDWQNRSTDTRKDIFGWARDGRMFENGFRVSLVRFFRAYGFSTRQAQNYALAIVRYRYGSDGAPGWRGVDDDFDNMRPGDNASWPTGDCVWNGHDDDGDWRGWRFQWIGSSGDRRSTCFQDQGVDYQAVVGMFADQPGMAESDASYHGRCPVWWPGRWDNCPTFFRLTGCSRADGGEVWGNQTGQTALAVAQEGRRVWACTSCGWRIGSALNPGAGSISIKCPYHGYGGSPCAATNTVAAGDILVVDEPTEGIDEDDEFDPLYAPLTNPFRHFSRWRTSAGAETATPQRSDDQPFGSIDEMVDALLERRNKQTGRLWVSSDGADMRETAVDYVNADQVDNDFDGVRDENDGSEEYAEACRVFNIVKEDITVNVADLDVGFVNINVDNWGWDGLNNDGNNWADEPAENMTNDAAEQPVRTSAALTTFSPKVAGLALAYRNAGINVNGAPAAPVAAGIGSPYLHTGHLTNIVDFQDKDPFPTTLYWANMQTAPYYFGTEGVHLNEVLLGAARVGAGLPNETETTINYVNGAFSPVAPLDADVNNVTGRDFADDGWKSLGNGMYELGSYTAAGTWDATTDGEEVEALFRIEKVYRGCYVAVIYGNSAVNGPSMPPIKVWVDQNGPTAARAEGRPRAEFAADGKWETIGGRPFRHVTIYNTAGNRIGPDEFGAANPPNPQAHWGTDFGSYYIGDVSSAGAVPLGAVYIANNLNTQIRVRAELQGEAKKPQFGIRFVNWFTEFVNISRKPIKLVDRGVNPDNGIDETLYLEIGDGGGASLTSFGLVSGIIPRGTATWCPPGKFGNENGAGNPAGRTDYIPGAHADGRFPPNYGYFVIALCEDAYDKTWGNASGTWGDEPKENYPVYFKEVQGTSGAYARGLGNPGIFMMGRRCFQNEGQAGIRVYARIGGIGPAGRNYLAGTWIDAFEGAPTAAGPTGVIDFNLSSLQSRNNSASAPEEPYPFFKEFVSIEKVAPVVPIWKTWLDPTQLVTFNEVWKQNMNANEGGVGNNEHRRLTRSCTQAIWRYWAFEDGYSPPGTPSGVRRWEANVAHMNCLNTRWQIRALDTTNSTTTGPNDNRAWIRQRNYAFAGQEKVAPMVWDGPFLSAGWLAFVPAPDWGPEPGPPDVGRVNPRPGTNQWATTEREPAYPAGSPNFFRHPWRNFTPRPHMADVFQPYINPLYTLLGLRVGGNVGRASYPQTIGGMRMNIGNWRPLACVPGVRAKINVNTASTPVLQAAFPSGVAAKIVKYRPYRCAEDIMGFPSPHPQEMLNGNGLVSRCTVGGDPSGGNPKLEQRPTFIANTTVRTGWLDFMDVDISSADSPSVNYVAEQWSKANSPVFTYNGNPLFSRYAFDTFSTNRWLDMASEGIGSERVDYNEDHDDSGAGMMLDDVVCDITEQVEWYLRYCNVIDIRSRFFTVLSRGRVFGPVGLHGDARVRAVVERPDTDNYESIAPLPNVLWYNPGSFRGPNGRPEGVTLKSIDLLDN
ncbi:MAG: hypothetical protein AB1696_24130 [Planctomycetota bacterium]